MDLANKIKKMLDTTKSEADKKILEHYLTEVNAGKQITEEEIMKELSTNKNLFEKFRNQEMESSKAAASKLMENWDSDRFSAKTSGSYIDGETEDVISEEESEELFYEMSREDLLKFIFGEEEEAGEEALEKYSNEELVQIAIEKNAKENEEKSEAEVLEPMEEKAKSRPAYKPLGVTSMIAKLKNSAISEHTSFKVLISKYDNLLKSHHLPESILIEGIAAELANFEWDDQVKESRKLLLENLTSNRAEVEVEKAIFNIKRSAGWKFYADAANIMNEWLKSGNDSSKLLAKNLRTWSFNPIVNGLINKLNEMESVKTGSLSIPTQQGESYVNNVYSPVYLSEGVTYFSIAGRFFKANSEGVSTINESLINEEFVSLVKTFESENVRISEKGIIYYVGKERVSIVEENEKTSVYVNGAKLSFDNKNTLAKLLESNFAGMFGSNGAKSTYDIIRLYENFENIVELDFIKSVKSKIYEGAEVNLIKWENKIYVNKVNPAMNENSLYPANGRQAVRFVKEYLNYDISEGLTDYLEGEDRIKAVMINDRTKVLENLKIIETELEKINKAISMDSRIAESKEVENAKKMLESEISKLKAKWSTISSEINKFDSIDFEGIESITEEEKFSIGGLVKIKESGDTGKIISIDGSSGTYTVLHDNGQTGDYKIDEIVDLDQALSKASDEEAEEKSGEEAEEESTETSDEEGSEEDIESAEEKQ